MPLTLHEQLQHCINLAMCLQILDPHFVKYRVKEELCMVIIDYRKDNTEFKGQIFVGPPGRANYTFTWLHFACHIEGQTLKAGQAIEIDGVELAQDVVNTLLPDIIKLVNKTRDEQQQKKQQADTVLNDARTAFALDSVMGRDMFSVDSNKIGKKISVNREQGEYEFHIKGISPDEVIAALALIGAKSAE